MVKTLVVSAGVFHPPFRGRRRLLDALRVGHDAQYETVDSMEALLGRDLNAYQAMVLCFHHKSISDEALRAFEGFVAGGGGVLAVHSATASFKTRPEYFEILGGRFTGHGAVKPFEIRPSIEGDEIFPSIPSFTVTDELYLHELNPHIRVHYHTEIDGEEVPMVWTYAYGQGRVCYTCPGHRSSSMSSPTYRRILQRGLGWVCDGSDPQPES